MRNRSYNQGEFGLEDVKWTLRNTYADNLARSSSHGKSVVGRGVAMHAQGDSSRVPCFNCSECGYCRKECPQTCDAKKRGLNRGKPHRKKNNRGEAAMVEDGVPAAMQWPWTRRRS